MAVAGAKQPVSVFLCSRLGMRREGHLRETTGPSAVAASTPSRGVRWPGER